jgi:hypothetical protein
MTYIRVPPTDDAYVEKESSENHGKEIWLCIGPYLQPTPFTEYWSFLRFDLTDLPITRMEKCFLSAWCWLTRGTIEIREVYDLWWGEDTINWFNKPRVGNVIAEARLSPLGYPYKRVILADVTDYVKTHLGGGFWIISFCLTSPDEFSVLLSKESGYAPWLTLMIKESTLRVESKGVPIVPVSRNDAFIGYTAATFGDGASKLSVPPYLWDE